MYSKPPELMVLLEAHSSRAVGTYVSNTLHIYM